MNIKCSDVGCGAYATWIRCTQFAGDHYFCDLHAKAEKGFGENNSSYFYWTTTVDHGKSAQERAAETDNQWANAQIEPPIADKVCQTLVMRKDLGMHKGKLVSQGGHAFMKDLIAIWRAGIRPEDLVGADNDYYNLKFRKIVLAANSEAELMELYEKAKAAGLKCELIIDSGETEFNGVPTKTCLCIGPHYKSQINPITGHLKPL